MCRTLGPVVMPANNHVAAVFAMTVLTKIFALKLKFDPHWLPLVRSHLALRLTIRESGLNDLNHVPELFGYHSEQEDNTLFVHGLMTKTPKIDGVSVDRTTPLASGVVVEEQRLTS